MGGLPIQDQMGGIPPYGRDMYSQYGQPLPHSNLDPYDKLGHQHPSLPNSYDPILPPSTQPGSSFLTQLTGLTNFEKPLGVVEHSLAKNPEKEGYDPLALSGETRAEGIHLPMGRLSGDEISKLN